MPSSSPLLSDDAFARGPRGALVAGSGLLILGLGMVGVGASSEGAVVALAGLLGTIYGIHSFGRLGPEEGGAERTSARRDPSPEALRAQGRTSMWTGGLLALAGFAVTFGASREDKAIVAYGAILAGIGRLISGLAAVGRADRADRALPRAARPAPAPRPRKKRREPSEKSD
jgi:hypothetical protein